MPDTEASIKGRKENLKKIWSSKEWKVKKAEFLKKNPDCAMHLSVGIKFPASLPHHPYRNSYKGHYDDLELSGCVAYCGKCHFALHKGRKLCPICKEKYPLWDQEMCTGCYNKAHPEIVEAKKKKVEETKALKKKLRDEEKERVKKWKKEYPKEGVLSDRNWT